MTPGPAPEGSAQPPTCYRHDGRETYIRCSRCERPICPDCMVAASVGFQCPECVREGNRSVRQATTIFGGAVGDPRPLVTWGLLVGCGIGYLLQLALGDAFTLRFELLGLARIGNDLIGVAAGEFYRLITVAFLHGSPLHLALNAYALYLFGPPLEAALGKSRYLAVYVLAALGGSAASYAFREAGGEAVGASGAVFGLLAATLVVNKRLSRDSSGLWVLLGLNVVLGFFATNIDWRAHLGGMLVGAVVVGVLAYAPKQRRTTWQISGMVVVAALIAGVVLVRTAQIRNEAGLGSLFGASSANALNERPRPLVPNVENSCGETTCV